MQVPAACCFGARFDLIYDVEAAINTFKDKLSINFQCWKSSIGSISQSRSNAVVNSESDDTKTHWKFERGKNVCVRRWQLACDTQFTVHGNEMRNEMFHPICMEKMTNT